MTYGELLKENRIRMHLTIGMAAKEIGISNQYLSEIERGKRKCLNSEKFENACCLYEITGHEKEELKRKGNENITLPQIPNDMELYIRKNPYIMEEIRKAMNDGLSIRAEEERRCLQ